MTAFYYRVWGCSWKTVARSCRLALHYNYESDGRYGNLGFRVFQEYK